jgi:hypothetical protein
MWLMIAGAFGFGLAILALIGLLAVAKELFCDRSLGADCGDHGAAGRHDVCNRVSRRFTVTR